MFAVDLSLLSEDRRIRYRKTIARRRVDVWRVTLRERGNPPVPRASPSPRLVFIPRWLTGFWSEDATIRLPGLPGRRLALTAPIIAFSINA